MLHILVVDEDPAGRKQAAAMLRPFGCTVTTVGDPDAALMLIRRARFDAVLVSAGLRHMPASAFVSALSREQSLSDVPVMVMAVTPRAAIEAIRVGARGYIHKPIDPGGLISALPELLSRHARRRGRTSTALSPA